MTQSAPEKSFDLFAEGLWTRLRDILMAQARWDGFVHDPDGRQAHARAEETWPSPDEKERVASEMVLRALRVAADPVNHAILRRLAQEEELALSALAEQTGLPRLALVETVNDLCQVGLASYAVETRKVCATAGAAGLLGLLDEARRRLEQILRERWTEAVR